MDLRRLQVTGGGTFLVSLPISWAKRNHLTRGSFVTVTERSDGSVTIDPKYSSSVELTSVSVPFSSSLEREIIGKYLLGYDIISVNSKERLSASDRERIKRNVSLLMGLEIVEENSHNVVLQCLLEPAAFPPERILRREYLIAAGMHRESISSFLEMDRVLATNVIERDTEVDRLYFLLVRLLRTILKNPKLSESLGIALITCLDYRLVASFVEALGDHATEIAKIVKDSQLSNISKETQSTISKISESIYDIHSEAMAALFSSDMEIAEVVVKKHSLVYESLHNLEEATALHDSKYFLTISNIVSAMRRICDCGKDVADLVVTP
jgi:phosphate uptake regulator